MQHYALKIVIFCLVGIAAVCLPVLGQDQASPKESDVSSAIQIEDAVISQDVVDRQPVGVSDVVAKENAMIYCFTRVVGAVGDTSVTHNWYYEGTLKSTVQLSVRSSNWRTWSSKTMDPAWTGQWMVEVLSADGTPLESIIFFVQ
jgi:hypothetical protein